MDDTVKTNNNVKGKMNEDEETWETLSKGLREAQAVLDENRVLIRQVNDNHHSRLADKLAENVCLIREISANISKLLGIYSAMSLQFSGFVRRRRRANAAEVDHTARS